MQGTSGKPGAAGPPVRTLFMPSSYLGLNDNFSAIRYVTDRDTLHDTIRYGSLYVTRYDS